MKELFFKKQNELDQICNKSHMEIPSQPEMENIINLINLGKITELIFYYSYQFQFMFKLVLPNTDWKAKKGEIDHADLLMSLDEQISVAKEEASSRKAIMEKVERWMLAHDEERWLEEYSMVNITPQCAWFVGSWSIFFLHDHSYFHACFQDENRYSVRRGAHKNLRRAERARVIVNKIPGKSRKLVGLQRILK